MKKLFSLLLALVMMLGLAAPAFAEEAAEAEPVTVLYTNDVHTYIDKDLNSPWPPCTATRWTTF